MEKQVDKMVPAGAQAKELHIEHVRNPGYGMPISLVTRAEGPLEIIPRQPTHDVRIVNDVKAIIEFDKIVVRDWREGDNGRRG